MSDASPDRHLAKALAHAPDRQAGPPEHLSAQILAAAHRATLEANERPAARQTPWWRKPWGASGALATLLMAGFLGLLWRGEPPGPAVDVPSPRVAESPQAPQAPQAGPAALPEVAAAQKAARAPAAEVMAQTAAAAPVAAPAIPPTSLPRKAQVQAETLKAEAASPIEPATAPAQTLAAAPTAPATSVAAADSVSPPQPGPAPAAPVLAALPTRPTLLQQSARAMAVAPQQSLPPLLPTDQFSWLPPLQAAAPDAAWIQQLANLAGKRWIPEERSPPADSAALRWHRGSTALGLLRLGPDAVWWCPTGQNCLVAKVPPDAMRDLISKLPSVR